MNIDQITGTCYIGEETHGVKPWAKYLRKACFVVCYRSIMMGKMLGYMLTWTTYGCWLQGDERGYVKDGKILGENEGLHKANLSQQKGPATKFNDEQQTIVQQAIIHEGQTLGQKIYALAVCSNHIHIVTNCIRMPIGKVISHYKNAVRLALRANGFVGKVWTKGYDKRYCFDTEELQSRIAYVRKHKRQHI